MKLAASVGLASPPVTTSRANGKDFLLVQRYDRFKDRSGAISRLHQEDFFCAGLSHLCNCGLIIQFYMAPFKQTMAFQAET